VNERTVIAGAMALTKNSSWNSLKSLYGREKLDTEDYSPPQGHSKDSHVIAKGLQSLVVHTSVDNQVVEAIGKDDFCRCDGSRECFLLGNIERDKVKTLLWDRCFKGLESRGSSVASGCDYDIVGIFQLEKMYGPHASHRRGVANSRASRSSQDPSRGRRQ
jgi:hypothetical protein